MAHLPREAPAIPYPPRGCDERVAPGPDGPGASFALTAAAHGYRALRGNGSEGLSACKRTSGLRP